MGMLFISHSSKDNERAIFVRDWLIEAGWGDVFLDLDPVAGLAPGQHWQAELRKAGERCAAVIVLVSPNWLASDWCRTEFLLAAQLGKSIFPVLIAPVAFDALPLELKAHYQMVDLSEPATEAEGLARFRIGLQRAGLHPEDFPWPPPGHPSRSPYRGLATLERCDAAVFFGREAAITKGLDTVRQMADGAPERVMVILGASGSGKSSFLQAGLLARLERDNTRFHVLPTMRPGRAPLLGPDGLLRALGLSTWVARDALAVQLDGLRAAARAATPASALAHDEVRPLTLVLAIDQAEELLDGSPESATTMACLADLVAADEHLLVLLTLRTDRFAQLQTDAMLGTLARRTFDLPPLPAGAFKQIVEAPGALADPPIEIDPALTERLLDDLGERDALPLLAFTLDWLLRSGRKRLSLDDYDRELGGLAGAIERAVSAALGEAVRDRALPDSHAELEVLIRQLFLPWLVQVDEAAGAPQRRVATIEELPAATRPLLVPLVGQRLLVTREDEGRASVEVVHEAVLRHWPALARWIDEDRGQLATLRAVQRAATDWAARPDTDDEETWLVHRGERLAEAQSVRQRAGFGAMFRQSDRAYLEACRVAEEQRVAALEAQAERERVHLARQRKQQRRVSIALGTIGVILTAFAVVTVIQMRAASEQVSLVLADYSARALAEGDATRAMRLGLLAAREGYLQVPAVTAGARLAAAAQASRLVRDFDGHQARVHSATLSTDESRLATIDESGDVRLWALDSGRALGAVKHEGRNPRETGARFSPDGTRLVSWGHDGSVVIRDALDGRVLHRLARPTSIWDVLVSSEADRLLTRETDTLTLWRLSDGEALWVWEGAGRVGTELFDDQQRFLAFDDTGTVSLRRLDDGRALSQMPFAHKMRGAEVLPDDNEVLVLGTEGESRIFDAATGRSLVTLETPNNTNVLAFLSDDRRRLAMVGFRETDLRLWDLDDPTRAVRVALPRPIYRLRWSHDGRTIATWGDGDSQIDLWQTDTGARLGGQQHDRGVGGVVFSDDDQRGLSWGSDGLARVWDVMSGKELSRFKHAGPVWDARFSRDQTRVFSWDASGVIQAWGALRLGSEPASVARWRASSVRSLVGLEGLSGLTATHGQGDAVSGIHELSRGDRIVSWGHGGRVQVWNARSTTQVWPLAPNRLTERALNASNHFLVSTPDGRIQAWDRHLKQAVSEPRRAQRLLDVAEAGGALEVLIQVSPQEARVWRTANDSLGPPIALPQTLRLGWMTSAGPRFLVSEAGGGKRYAFVDAGGGTLGAFDMDSVLRYESVRMSRDGRRALAMSGRGEVRVIDLESGRTLLSHLPEKRRIFRALMSESGQFVIISDNVDTQIWSSRDGTLQAAWRAEGPDLENARFLEADGQVLLVFRSGRVALRQLLDGALIWRVTARAGIADAAVSPSGGQLMTWDRDGLGAENLRVWDVRSGVPMAYALQAESVQDAMFPGDAGTVLFQSGDRASLRQADLAYALASDAPDLFSRVCTEKLLGGDASAPSVRRLSPADVDFAPILAGREGEDVCR